MSTITDFVIRFRTWIVNVVAVLLILLPEILNSPELLAVVPPSWQRWVLLAAFLLNIWMRPRPATRSGDAEVKVAKTLKTIDAPAAAVVVRPVNAEPIHVATVATGAGR